MIIEKHEVVVFKVESQAQKRTFQSTISQEEGWENEFKNAAKARIR